MFSIRGLLSGVTSLISMSFRLQRRLPRKLTSEDLNLEGLRVIKNAILRSFAYNLHYSNRLLRDIPDDRMSSRVRR